jgi:hypothetical protein
MAEDENAGLGGSYIIDKDGVRRLVQRTEDAAVEPAAPKRVERKTSTDADVGSAEPKDE